jgi:signal transduction histidine kinase
MDATNPAAQKRRGIARRRSPARIRLVGFALVIFLGSVGLYWITRTTWKQLQLLQKEHAAVRSESFYLGASLRSHVRNLNGRISEYGRTRDESISAEFVREAAQLKQWFVDSRVHLGHLAELKLLQEMGVTNQLEILDRANLAFDDYFHAASCLITPGARRQFQESENEESAVRTAGTRLSAVCDELVQAQAEGFGEFLAATQQTLGDHHRLLQLSSALILALAITLTLMTYRGMIAPLRRQLSASRSIIDRQEKLASLGVLASGVAHEIRNPLTAIKIRLFNLKKAIPAVARNEEASLIADEINRLERIIRDFLRFARPSQPEFTRVSANQLVQDVGTLLRPQLERNSIELKVQALGTPWVHADAQQMKQVLINLVQNSAEHMGRNGTVVLRTGLGEARINGRRRSAAVIAVEDNGKGIAPEVEDRLFDPFFTTKESGTGLGLSIAARIVETHGGLLRYETKVDCGTTFEVVLPRIEHDPSGNSDH